MNWVAKQSCSGKGVKIESFKINRLLFADDVVLLALLKSDFQHHLAAGCDGAEMKIRVKKAHV